MEWYSTDTGNEADISIIGSIDLSTCTGPLLSFDTKFDIEGIWDFGFTKLDRNIE